MCSNGTKDPKKLYLYSCFNLNLKGKRLQIGAVDVFAGALRRKFWFLWSRDD